ncbi:MAG: alpha/beta hydrolase [Candidatus Omnitrophica bacterium]|nr:alpha/beta hydrolase [Candidatus Omnitrophota bacterium]
MAEIIDTPKTIKLEFEDLYLKTSDNIDINGWFIPNEKAKSTLLFFHGNGGNISHRLEKISFLHKMDLNIFIIDYRGYGKSKGKPNETGLYRDAEAAYQYLLKKKNIPAENIILYGESLGGAVAVEIASKHKVKAVITEDTFTSVKEMSKIVYPFLPTFFLYTKFDSLSKIKDIKVPKLIIHSTGDEIVPFELGQKLFNEASEPKEFLKLRGSHNTAFFDSMEDFRVGILDFFSKIDKR